jgi:TRAP-type mannitol/chloroaromatic compound transport system substrate-binding protein
MKRKLLAIALILVLAISMAACAPAAPTPTPGGNGDPDDPVLTGETFHWRSQTFSPPGTLYHQLHQAFADKVREMSGGRLVIEIFGAGELVEVNDQPAAVRDGIIDAAVMATSVWGIEYAAPLFSATPGLFSNPMDHLMWLEFGGGFQLWREMTDRFNVRTFPVIITHAENFLWSNVPIHSISDLQGLNIRMMPLGGEILQANGVGVVFMPGGEIVPALERAVIDAGEFATSSMDVTMGFQDVATYVHKPGWHQPAQMLEISINGAAFDALPSDLQRIVEVATRANTIWSLGYSAVRDAEAEVFFIENGNEIVVLSPEILNTLNQWADAFWVEAEAADPFLARIRQSQRDFMQWWVPNRAMLHIDYPEWVWDRQDEIPFILSPGVEARW